MLELVFDTKALSLNNSQGFNRKGFKYKKPATKAWENRINLTLRSQDTKIKDFMKDVTDKDVFFCSYCFFIDENEYFTKKGTVSKTTGDLSNLIKHLEDLICKYMGINDGAVVSLSSMKKEAFYSETQVTISKEKHTRQNPLVTKV